MSNKSLAYIIILVVIAFILNLGLGYTIRAEHLPFFLDTLGTVLVGVLLGPWWGAFTGVISNLLSVLYGMPVSYSFFAVVAGLVGMLSGWFAEAGWFFESWPKAAGSGFLTGVASALLSDPIAKYLYGRNNFPLWVDPFDKLATFVIAWLLIKYGRRLFTHLRPRERG